MKGALRTIHRRLSLAVAIFWLIQASTGVLSTFHWELDDLAATSLDRPTDVAAIGRRLEALEAADARTRVSSIWATAGLPNRYDVTLSDQVSGASTAVLIAGDGTILRTRSSDEWLAHGGIFETIVGIHHNLLAGDRGAWIVGVSGIFLLTNILLGLRLAWPAPGSWRRALRPMAKGAPAARTYSWHRAVGLWAAIPAAVLVLCGTLLVFEHGVGEAIGADEVAPDLTGEAMAPPRPTSPGQALALALARHPGSTFAGMQLPDGEDAWYRIRTRQPGEVRRVYGTTVIYVSARTGRILGDFSAFEAPPARRFMELLYPLHTGEAGGLPGRLAVTAIGLWLLTMIVLGVRLWWARRRAGRRAVAGGAGS